MKKVITILATQALIATGILLVGKKRARKRTQTAGTAQSTPDPLPEIDKQRTLR